MREHTSLANPVTWSTLRQQAGPHHEVLLLWLADHAIHHGHSVVATAHVLDVTPAYLVQLCSGYRSIARAGSDFYAAVSRYLGLASVVVRCAAGDLRLEDFYTESQLEQLVGALKARLPDAEPAVSAMNAATAAFGCQLAGLAAPGRCVIRNLVADGPPLAP